MFIVYGGVGWLLGLCLAAAVAIHQHIWLSLFLLALGLSLSLRRWARLAPFLIMIPAIFAGAYRFQSDVPVVDSNHIAAYHSASEVTIKAHLLEPPDVRDEIQLLRLEAETITLPGLPPQPINGRLLATVSPSTQILLGDELQLRGRPRPPDEIPGFDYPAYLASYRILTTMSFPTVEVIGSEQVSPLARAAIRLRTRAADVISGLLPGLQAELLKGILLGQDHGLSESLSDAFRITGMTHIIAISGFNIAILVAGLSTVTQQFFRRRAAILVALTGVAFYTVLVGAEPAVMRAAVMGSLYLVTLRWFGRTTYPFAVLLLAAFVMTLFDPFTVQDISFQLSFGATLGLMLYTEPITRWLQTWLQRKTSRDSALAVIRFFSGTVIATFAAQILTLPLMAARFNNLSLISPLANFFILPAQPGLMMWGGLAAITGLAAPPIAQILAHVAWLFLAYTTFLVRFFSAVPGASIPIHLSSPLLITIYVPIAVLTWFIRLTPEKRASFMNDHLSHHRRKALFAFSLFTFLLAAAYAVTQPDGRLHITFLDVGQGDAIFIETPTGRQVLVDGGHFPIKLSNALGHRIPFWDKSIDMVIATHADADHVTGLPEVFKRYEVEQLITNGTGSGEAAAFDQLLQEAEAAGTSISVARAGQYINIGDGVRFEVLHPDSFLNGDDRNDSSICMRITFGHHAVLLTGDAGFDAEQVMLVSGSNLTAQILKAAHHGSRDSSSERFLAATRPRFVIISAGKDNKFGHPHSELLQRAADIGAAVLRTDELGSIEMISDGETIWWQAEKE